MDFSQFSLDTMNRMSKNTLMQTLDITFTEAGEDYIVATMPVDHRTHQPMGLLHGGASAALVETIGSLGSALLCDLSKEHPVGGVKSGLVKGIGKLVHGGKRSHVWQVDIFSEETQKLICTGRLTVLIVSK
jgi:1,4-dihydroxy-2-naphthoyl-CoA hydrolase